MISKLAKGIAHFFVINNIAEKSKEVIYAYGMELLISDILVTLLREARLTKILQSTKAGRL